MRSIMRKRIMILNIFLVLILIFLSKNIIIDNFFNETMVVVPDVTNMDKDDAIKKLKKSKLYANVISTRSSDVPINYIYSQLPIAGEVVKKNRVIKIFVNDNKSNEVPDLVGKTLTEAMSYLENNNIEIKRVDYIHTDADDNTVLAIYPNTRKIAYGEKICLLVSTKETMDKNVMPDIVGLDVNEANRVLAQIGLKISDITKVDNTTYPSNVIVSCSPAPNMSVSKGTKVSVVISAPNDTTSADREKIKQDNIDEIIKKAVDSNNTEDNKEGSEGN
ncbi:PASTA domain-containing protein [Sneathia sp. DSM 16631]|uniref:PASTA domain-containing protein n=1 Tax=Sneathia TaxID=168808 RepID=UPI001868C4B6|nr:MULTISPECIES: PASTA domain-containing protein [Sneathia]MBE3031253.1 PASTA domain-containing protein [Sneathia sp. DSM 16631]MDK9581485.1 PASTA domain-containing protein [Sneathia vaginalis]